MSSRKTQAAKAAQTSQGNVPGGAMVYCGPSIRGVAKQYAVFSGEIPAALENKCHEIPMLRGLIVPLARFAAVRNALEIKGTAEQIMFAEINKQL